MLSLSDSNHIIFLDLIIIIIIIIITVIFFSFKKKWNLWNVPIRYANCECADCTMVEERRRLNNMLSLRRLDPNHMTGNRTTTGKKIRDPKCALCSAHGNKQPLRGHKKASCPFLKCGCHLVCLWHHGRKMYSYKKTKTNSTFFFFLKKGNWKKSSCWHSSSHRISLQEFLLKTEINLKIHSKLGKI